MTPEQIVANLTARGLVLESKLICDEFDGRTGNSVWSVTLTRNGQLFQTEYSMGAAHRHYRKAGGVCPVPFDHLSSVRYGDIELTKRSKPNQPEITDVVYSIVIDAQSVANGEAFEEWAAAMGYNDDSRQAEKCFDACRDEYFALVRLFGQDEFEELCELFQDY